MFRLQSLIALMFVMLFVFIGCSANPFGHEDEFDRQFLHFGKRAGDLYGPEDGQFNRDFMSFGKRASPYEQWVEKKFNREFMPFGRRR